MADRRVEAEQLGAAVEDVQRPVDRPRLALGGWSPDAEQEAVQAQRVELAGFVGGFADGAQQRTVVDAVGALLADAELAGDLGEGGACGA